MITSGVTSGLAWTMDSLTSPEPVCRTSIHIASFWLPEASCHPCDGKRHHQLSYGRPTVCSIGTPLGAPEIDELWYGRWHGPQPIDFFETLTDQIVPFGEAIATNLVRMNLPNRVRTLAMAG